MAGDNGVGPQRIAKYAYPDEQGSSPGTSDNESPPPARRFTSLDGVRDSISKRRELRKIVSTDPDTRLEPGQVRLLYFKHSKRSKRLSAKSTIKCSRYIFDLNNAPRFKALSYTCGPPHREVRRKDDGFSTLEEPLELLDESQSQIRCDDRVTPIYSNLYDALLTLRLSLRRDVWLCLDALCIQQEDQEERADQVKQMDKIYTSAEEVIVWLGRPLGLRYDVLEFMRDFCNVSTRLLDPSTGSIQTRYRNTEIQNASWHSILGIADSEDKLMDLMIFLKLCRYFSRLWVLQEVALADKPSIMWYNRMENFYCVTYLVDYFQKAGWFPWLDEMLGQKNNYLPGKAWMALEVLRSSILRFDSSTFETSFFRLRSGTPLSRTSRSFFDFAELLHYSRSLTCSDARDKIYSLLGFASRKIEAQLRDIALVDYTMPVEELYTRVQQRIVIETQCVDLLSFVGGSLSPSDPALPSWVPDYKTVYGSESAVEVYLQPQTPVPHPFLELETGQQYVSVKGAALCAWGALFDEVEHSFREPDGACSVKDWVPTHQAAINVLLSTPSSSMGPSIFTILLNTELLGTLELQPDRKEAFTDEMDFCYAVYLILNHVYKGSRGDRSVACTIERCDWLLSHVKYWGVDESLLLRIKGLVKEVKQAVVPCNDPAEITDKFQILRAKYDTVISRFVSWAKRVSNNRVLIRTEKGLLASAQTSVEKGDRIFILAGSRTAYVLRKARGEDDFVLVGDCFIWHRQHEGLLEEISRLQKEIRPVRIV